MRQQIYEDALKAIVAKIDTSLDPEMSDMVARAAAGEAGDPMLIEEAGELMARKLDEIDRIARDALDRKSDPAGMSSTNSTPRDTAIKNGRYRHV